FHSDLHPIAYRCQPYLGTLLRVGLRLAAAEQATEEARLVLSGALLRIDVIHTGAAIQVIDMDVGAGQCLTHGRPGAAEVGVHVQHRVAGTVLIQRAAPRGRRVTGTGQGHRVGTATLAQVAFQLGQNGPLVVAFAGRLWPRLLGAALAPLFPAQPSFAGAGPDTGFNTDPQAQFLSIGAAVLTDRRRQAPYQRVVRVHVEAQPAGLQLTEGSRLPGDRHTVVVEELTHPRPHGGGAMLGQQ